MFFGWFPSSVLFDRPVEDSQQLSQAVFYLEDQHVNALDVILLLKGKKALKEERYPIWWNQKVVKKKRRIRNTSELKLLLPLGKPAEEKRRLHIHFARQLHHKPALLVLVVRSDRRYGDTIIANDA